MDEYHKLTSCALSIPKQSQNGIKLVFFRVHSSIVRDCFRSECNPFEVANAGNDFDKVKEPEPNQAGTSLLSSD